MRQNTNRNSFYLKTYMAINLIDSLIQVNLWTHKFCFDWSILFNVLTKVNKLSTCLTSVCNPLWVFWVKYHSEVYWVNRHRWVGTNLIHSGLTFVLYPFWAEKRFTVGYCAGANGVAACSEQMFTDTNSILQDIYCFMYWTCKWIANLQYDMCNLQYVCMSYASRGEVLQQCPQQRVTWTARRQFSLLATSLIHTHRTSHCTGCCRPVGTRFHRHKLTSQYPINVPWKAKSA